MEGNLGLQICNWLHMVEAQECATPDQVSILSWAGGAGKHPLKKAMENIY